MQRERPGHRPGGDGNSFDSDRFAGNENALSFSLSFDPTKLTLLSATSSVPFASVVLNTNLVASGRIGVVLSLPVNQSLAGGIIELLKVTFQAGLSIGSTAIGFANSPAPQSASDSSAEDLISQFVNGTVSVVGPPLAPASRTGSGASSGFVISWPNTVTGAVLEASATLGAGWTNASVTLTLNGGSYSASIPATGTARFYRLRLPSP